MGDIPRIKFAPSDFQHNYTDIKCGVNGTYNMIDGPFYQLFGTHQRIMGFIHLPTYNSFYFSYLLTLFSCTCGILRFLDAGPTRILERDGWRNFVGYGLAGWGVLTSLHTKGLGLGNGGPLMQSLIKQFGYGKLSRVFKNARNVNGFFES